MHQETPVGGWYPPGIWFPLLHLRKSVRLKDRTRRPREVAPAATSLNPCPSHPHPWSKRHHRTRWTAKRVYVHIYIYIYISGVKISALTREINFFRLKIFNAINAGAGLGLATPFTTAASVSFFLKRIAFI